MNDDPSPEQIVADTSSDDIVKSNQFKQKKQINKIILICGITFLLLIIAIVCIMFVPRLQKTVDELTIENNRLQQERYELERLQELYALDQNYADYKKVGAHVTANDSGNWFSSFTIDKGEQDGIKKDMNVMAGTGLVGIVTEVGPNWARVRSIIDDSSNVSALILSTSDKCIVKGDLTLMNDGKIRFEQLANNGSEIKEGEQVVASHISSKYLQGILIGYVSEITTDANNLTRSGYITPAVDFQHLQEVLVITTTKEEMLEKEE